MFLGAKERLDHGQWEAMFESGKLKFSLRTAQKLMQVAQNQVLTKAKNSSFLPPCLEVLTILGRLDAGIVEEGINTGEICAEMTIADAKRFALDQTTGDDNSPKPFDYEKHLKATSKQVGKRLEPVPHDLLDAFLADLTAEINTYHPAADSSTA